MCVYTCVCAYACVHTCVCVCVCTCMRRVCGLSPPWTWHLLWLLLFHHVLPSKVIVLSCVSPQEQGRQPPLSCPPCGLLCTGWDMPWVWEGPPQVLICDLWLRVQPATTFRAGLGGQGAIWGRPRDRIPPRLLSYELALAQNRATVVWGLCVGPRVVTSGLLGLSSGLTAAPPLPQDGSPAGAPPAAPPRAKSRVPGSLRSGPASGHQPLPTDVRGQ